MTSFDSGSFVMQLIIATPSPFKIIHRLVDLVADGVGDDAVMTFLENQRTEGMITKCRLNRHFVFAIQWNGFRMCSNQSEVAQVSIGPALTRTSESEAYS